MTQAFKKTASKAILRLLALALVAGSFGSTAGAQRAHRWVVPAWHGDISRFHEHDWNLWRSGRWAHARHDGRMGWWWVVGPSWYFYPSPVYPYPSPWEPPASALVSPPQGTVPSAPPTQYWYYCDAAHGYYPYVPTCPEGWVQKPAAPVDAMPAEPK